MTIVDDGPGFAPALPDPGGTHLGLQVMGKRAERIGGRLAVHSAPGRGTQVEVCVPLVAENPKGLEDPSGSREE